jgi:hypothetical protein
MCLVVAVVLVAWRGRLCPHNRWSLVVAVACWAAVVAHRGGRRSSQRHDGSSTPAWTPTASTWSSSAEISQLILEISQLIIDRIKRQRVAFDH